MTISIHDAPRCATDEHPIQKIVLPGQTSESEYILAVLVKRSYDIVPGSCCRRAKADRKLVAGDIHYDDPINSTVQFETDLVPFKPATDVVLNGRVYAPPGRRVSELKASLIIDQRRKDLLVLGDRMARYREKQDPVFTDPELFETIDLRYERAYGGVDIFSNPEMQSVYPRNHLGRGYVISNTRRSVEKLLLPNIEDPNDPLTPDRLCLGDFKNWERQPMPEGFGWRTKTCLPRASYAGIMPADRGLERELRRAYSALVPPAQRKIYEGTSLPVIDFRFFNGASSALVLPFISGSEQVRLVNLDPSGDTKFQLPGERPRIGLDIGKGMQEPLVVMHTLMIRAEDLQIDLVWRGAVPYPGPDWLPEMKKMEVLIS